MTAGKVLYACPDCGDRFALPSSLSQHLSRRSIIIRYWCRICKMELQFFNRCVLLKHLRSHNSSLKHIDTTCITFSPISKEVMDNGVISSFFKEDTTNSSLPSEECILKNGEATRMINHIDTNEKSVHPANTLNTPNQNITTTAGHSKSICLQTQQSLLLSRPAQNSKNTILPLLLPKQQKLSVIQTVPNQTKDQSPVSNKTPPKSVILLCNKLPKQNTVKQTTFINTIPPNVLCQSTFRGTVDNGVSDDNSNDKYNGNVEEEEIDVENVTGDNNFSVENIAAVSPTHNEKAEKSKDKTSSHASQKSVRRYCSECGIPCLNISKHLNGPNRPINPNFTCKVCKVILPTKCSLKIHLRIHMKIPPYKCPDCGKDFTTWDEAHAHLKFSCGHLAKCVRYMCVSCKAHFPSSSALSQHISTKHARDIFKCNACPVAFFNKSSLEKHMLTNHPNETVLGMDYKQCSMCPKKLVPMDKFPTHVEEHMNIPNVLIYGFKCPVCGVVFANKMAFIIHQIKEKSEMEGTASKKVKKRKTGNCKKITNQNQITKDQQNVVEDLCHDSNSDLEEEIAIVPKKNLGPMPSSTEKDPLSLDDWEYTQEQRLEEEIEELCIVCKKNSVVLLPGIDLNEQSLCCKQCVKPIDFIVSNGKMQYDSKQKVSGRMNNSANSNKRKRSYPKSVQRSSSCDEIKTLQKKQRTDYISRNNNSPENEISMDLFSEFMPTKKKSKKKQSKDKIGQARIQGEVITSKSADELVCSKCQFVADTKESFLDHITTHRTDPNTFQCLECGLCFVVLPSLERHLQMHHGIKDVNSYVEKNRASLPQKVVEMEEETDDNQCRVCYEVFDSQSSLEKHFRTHGMAFMNRLTKSP